MSNTNDFGFGGFGGFPFFEAAQTPAKEEVKAEVKTEKKAETKAPASVQGTVTAFTAPAKADDKKDAKKEDKKPAVSGAKKVTGPVLCIGSGWTATYGDEGKTYGVKVVAKAMYEAGYTEIAATKMVYVSDENPNVLIFKGIGLSGNDDAEVLTKKVEVVTGLTKAMYEAKDFNGMDADEVSVRDLAEKYVESYPDFKGCSLKFSRAAKVCAPFFTKKADIKDDQTYRVWGTLETANVKGADLEAMYGSDDYKVEFFVSDNGVLFPSYTGKDAKCAVSITEDDLGLKAAKSKKAVEKYVLPANIYITAIGKNYENVTSEMFGGKDRVTKEEVIEWLKSQHRVFNQSDRKFDVIYDDVTNTISVAILSGSKGGAAVAAPFFVSQLTGEIVQNLPLGVFKGFATEDDIEDVSFQMSLPKIPHAILDSIVQDFKRDLKKEAIRQIVYDRNKDEYMIFRPVAKCTKTHISYEFPKLLRSQVLAMTVHSHNTMPAWFSSVDDRDEVVTGLYGVVGCLDRKEPQMNFRASLEGSFIPVDESEIFSFGKGVYVA